MLTVKLEDVSITGQRADVGCPIRVDYAESEELGWRRTRLGGICFRPVLQVSGLLLLLLFGVAVLWLRTHLVVHCLLLT